MIHVSLLSHGNTEQNCFSQATAGLGLLLLLANKEQHPLVFSFGKVRPSISSCKRIDGPFYPVGQRKQTHTLPLFEQEIELWALLVESLAQSPSCANNLGKTVGNKLANGWNKMGMKNSIIQNAL